MTRRIVSLALSLILTLGGAAGLVYLTFFAAGWKGWMFIAAAFVMGVGLVWLWSDLIGSKPRENSN